MADVSEVLTLTQIKKLKVSELRERLAKLNKTTNGLKPELVNRLFEALFEAQKNKLSNEPSIVNTPTDLNYSTEAGNIIKEPKESAENQENEEKMIEEPTEIEKNKLSNEPSIVNTPTDLNYSTEVDNIVKEHKESEEHQEKEEKMIEEPIEIEKSKLSIEPSIINTPNDLNSTEEVENIIKEPKKSEQHQENEVKMNEEPTEVEKNKLSDEQIKVNTSTDLNYSTEVDNIVKEPKESKEHQENEEKMNEELTEIEKNKLSNESVIVNTPTDLNYSTEVDNIVKESKEHQENEEKVIEEPTEIEKSKLSIGPSIVNTPTDLNHSKEEVDNIIKEPKEHQEDEEKMNEEPIEIKKSKLSNEPSIVNTPTDLNYSTEVDNIVKEPKESEEHQEKEEKMIEEPIEIEKSKLSNEQSIVNTSTDLNHSTEEVDNIIKEPKESEEQENKEEMIEEPIELEKKIESKIDEGNEKETEKPKSTILSRSLNTENKNDSIKLDEGEKEKGKDSEKPQKVTRERKRRWGSSLTNTGANGLNSAKNIKGISSDSLKELIPDLNKSNTQVSNKLVDTKKDSKQNIQTSVTPENNTLNTQTQISTNISGVGQSNSGSSQNDGLSGNTAITNNSITKNVDIEISEKGDSRIIKRNLSLEEKSTDENKIDLRRFSTGNLSLKQNKMETDQIEEEHKKREQSPPKNPTTNIIFIRNLVRPFTLLQLKEILNRSGKINEDKFWIDKIKSKCYVAYENEESALEARKSLHGLRWPDANPKTLNVDFAKLDELEYHLNLDNPDKNTPEQDVAHKEDNRRSENKLSKGKYDIVIKKVSDDRDKEHQTNKYDKNESKSKEKVDNRREDEKRPIRPWDLDKLNKSYANETVTPAKKQRRSRSASPRHYKEYEEKERSRREIREEPERHKESHKKEVKEKQTEPDPSANLLDGLFRKTKATPCIYWLPLDEEHALKRCSMRDEIEKKRFDERMAREAEKRRRFEEINRNRRTPPYSRRGMSPSRFRGRGSYPFRRGGGSGGNGPPMFRRRERSESGSDRSSRSRSRSRTRDRSLSRTRSKSHSPQFRRQSRGASGGPRRSRSPRRSPRRR